MILTPEIIDQLRKLAFTQFPSTGVVRYPHLKSGRKPSVYGLPTLPSVGFRADRANTDNVLVFATSDLRLTIKPLRLDVSTVATGWYHAAAEWLKRATYEADRVADAQAAMDAKQAAFEARWKGQLAEIEQATGTTFSDIRSTNAVTIRAPSGDVDTLNVLVNIPGTPQQIADRYNRIQAILNDF